MLTKCRRKVGQAMVTGHLHTSKAEPGHTVLIFNAGYTRDNQEFPTRGDWKPCNNEGLCEFLELALYRTCDSVLCGVYCAYLILPRNSSILTPHGALSSV